MAKRHTADIVNDLRTRAKERGNTLFADLLTEAADRLEKASDVQAAEIAGLEEAKTIRTRYEETYACGAAWFAAVIASGEIEGK